MRTALCLIFAVLLSSCSQAESPDEKAVRAHLERYFSTWSSQDMAGYESCFFPQARITFSSGGRVNVEGLTDFLYSQRMCQQQATTPMKEEPKEMKITLANDIAQASVKWELHKSDGNTTGTDMFTLVRIDGGWKIAALVWEQNR